MAQLDSQSIRYGGVELRPGDEFTAYFYVCRERGTYVAKSDEGVVIFPEVGSRMVAEMLLDRWVIVEARVKLLKLIRKRDGKFFAVVRPLEWRGVYK